VDAKDVVANIARGSFLPVTLTSGSTEVSLVSADLPKGGYWKICYCATDELCTQTIDYGNTAGTLSVRGASGVQTFNCVKEVQCGIQVAGTLLDTTDYVQAVTATCGGANVAQFSTPRPLAGGGTATAQPFNFGFASLQGVYIVCYCPGHIAGGSGSACDDANEYTHAAGQLTVAGPTGNEDRTCSAGVACTLASLSGIALSATDVVEFVPSTGVSQ
jgi:hypothetical protein